jgi:hypothetical protein
MRQPGHANAGRRDIDRLLARPVCSFAMISTEQAAVHSPPHPVFRRWFKLLAAATVVSALATWCLFIYGAQPLIEDSHGYYALGVTISQVGLADFIAVAHGRRTYGYPLVIAAVVGVVGTDPATVQASVAVVQWIAHVAVSALFAWRISQVVGLARYGPLVYLACIGHPSVLANVSTLLTDSLSATAVLAVAALVLPVGAGRPVRWSLALSALLAATATIIRPANLIILLALPVVWGARTWLLRDVPIRAMVLAVAVVGLPFIPQMVANSRASGVPNPMLENDLYGRVTANTMTRLKYGTMAIEGIPPQLRYFNPFAPADARTSADVRRDAPAAIPVTYALHLFTILDQDYLFTYITELHPPYRLPLALFHHTFLLVAAWGFLVGLRTGALRRTRFALGALLLLVAAYLAVYLPTSPENRFGIPVFLMVTPGVAIGLYDVAARLRPPRRRTTWYLLVGWLVLLAGGISLHQWVREQSPILRGEHPPLVAPPTPTNPPPAVPSGDARWYDRPPILQAQERPLERIVGHRGEQDRQQQ